MAQPLTHDQKVKKAEYQRDYRRRKGAQPAPPLQGHGTRACYRRGCSRTECVEANREYARLKARTLYYTDPKYFERDTYKYRIVKEWNSRLPSSLCVNASLLPPKFWEVCSSLLSESTPSS